MNSITLGQLSLVYNAFSFTFATITMRFLGSGPIDLRGAI